MRAIQLASCLHLQEALAAEVIGVAIDDRLATAAIVEGLKLSWKSWPAVGDDCTLALVRRVSPLKAPTARRCTGI